MSTVFIMSKQDLLDRIRELPDDAVFIKPIHSPHGYMKGETKGGKNLVCDVRLLLPPDIPKDPESISVWMRSHLMPILWITREDAEKVLGATAIDLIRSDQADHIDQVDQEKS